jgi:histidinol-phosphate/aromatic aminotransferase/cobyric acid decarboxylase-like protein
MQVEDANRLCDYLKQHDILISNRNSLLNCKNHVRISIGTNKEMNQLFKALKKFK